MQQQRKRVLRVSGALQQRLSNHARGGSLPLTSYYRTVKPGTQGLKPLPLENLQYPTSPSKCSSLISGPQVSGAVQQGAGAASPSAATGTAAGPFSLGGKRMRCFDSALEGQPAWQQQPLKRGCMGDVGLMGHAVMEPSMDSFGALHTNRQLHDSDSDEEDDASSCQVRQLVQAPAHDDTYDDAPAKHATCDAPVKPAAAEASTLPASVLVQDHKGQLHMYVPAGLVPPGAAAPATLRLPQITAPDRSAAAIANHSFAMPPPSFRPSAAAAKPSGQLSRPSGYFMPGTPTTHTAARMMFSGVGISGMAVGAPSGFAAGSFSGFAAEFGHEWMAGGGSGMVRRHLMLQAMYVNCKLIAMQLNAASALQHTSSILGEVACTCAVDPLLKNVQMDQQHRLLHGSIK